MSRSGGAHTPLWHTWPGKSSPVEHRTPWDVGRCRTPVSGSQLSALHGLPSSTTGTGPFTHTPEPLQVSAPLQAFPSPQLAPAGLGTTCHPAAGSHTAWWHVPPAASTGGAGGVPGVQTACWQVSLPVQALPSG